MFTALPKHLKTSFAERGCIMLSDDSSPDGRAVLVAPASAVSEDIVNEIIKLTGGLFFVALPSERVNGFLLDKMSRPSTSHSQRLHPQSLDMCVSVEARESVTTGISVHDRVVTLHILGEKVPNPRKLVSPGHIFPVQVSDGGALLKNALPEGALDAVSLAGFPRAALFVDLLGADGELVTEAKQIALSEEHSIPRITLSEVVRHLLSTVQLVQRITDARLPTAAAGELRSVIYKSTLHAGEHLALIKGDISGDAPVLTRVQTESTFSDVFGGASSTRSQLNAALQALGKQERGVLIYLRRQADGYLTEQIEDTKEPTFKPSSLMRDYGLGAQILRDLGVTKIEILTNSTKNLAGLTAFGIEIVAKRPL